MSEVIKCELCDWESGDNLTSLPDYHAHQEHAHAGEGVVVAFHPVKPELVTFYEVVDEQGISEWGGNSATEAVEWLRRSPVGSRLLVSGWDSELEDAHLVGAPLDITKIVFATLAEVM